MKRALVLVALAAIAAFALSGSMLRGASADTASDTTCNSASPCIDEKNVGSGDAIRGISSNNTGVAGQTKFPSTTNAMHAGVYGLDASSTGTRDAGVFGQSTNGDAGLFKSVNGNGIIATSVNAEGIGVLSTNGIGVRGIGPTFVGVDAEGGFNQGDGTIYPALSVVGESSLNGPPDLIDACAQGVGDPCQSLFSVLALDQSGNLTIAGQIFTSGSCSVGCAKTSHDAGKRVISYSPREAEPTMEDAGEAQLVNGRAFVPLGSDFANVIDSRHNYLVFITPEGDSRGLFVTGKTSSGFTVRENGGGKSTLAFSYRLVAKPFGAADVRLPTIERRAADPNRIVDNRFEAAAMH